MEAVYDRLGTLPARIVAGRTIGLHQPPPPPIVGDKSISHQRTPREVGFWRCRIQPPNARSPRSPFLDNFRIVHPLNSPVSAFHRPRILWRTLKSGQIDSTDVLQFQTSIRLEALLDRVCFRSFGPEFWSSPGKVTLKEYSRGLNPQSLSLLRMLIVWLPLLILLSGSTGIAVSQSQLKKGPDSYEPT